MGPENLLGGGKPAGGGRIRPADLGRAGRGVAELAAPHDEDAAGAADLVFLFGERKGLVGPAPGLVHQLPGLRIEGERVAVLGVGHRLGTLRHLRAPG